MSSKSKSLSAILLIVLLTLISYGQTIFMYFWQDDSALIFKLQHQAEIAGSFGAGLFDRGPYRYLVVPFVPFFPFFKLNPLGYFFVGFLTYLLIIAAFYWMMKGIIKDKKVIFFSLLVFASGYIGSDTMFRVINSWQTNLGIFFGLITIGFYLRLKTTKIPLYYIIAIVVYLLSIEFVFIRSHALIAAIAIIEVGDVVFNKIKIRNILFAVLRLIPFLCLFSVWYLQDASFGAPGIKTIFNRIFADHEWTLMMPLIANIGEATFPEAIALKIVAIIKSPWALYLLSSALVYVSAFLLYKRKIIRKGILFVTSLLFLLFSTLCFVLYKGQIYYFRDLAMLFDALVASVVLSFLISISFTKASLKVKLLSFLGLTILVSQIASYYIQYPTSIFSTTHRYYSYAFVGYIIITAVVFLLIKKYKKISYLLLLTLTVPMLLLSFKYQNKLLTDRSIPSSNFYRSLLTFVPSIEKGSIFYFDIERNPYSEKQFGDFFSVGSMPDTTALAIYYQLDRYDMLLITNPDELFFALSKDPILINKTYAFKYSKEGLKDNTLALRTLLTERKSYKLPQEIPSDTYLEADLTVVSKWNSYTKQTVKSSFSDEQLISAINETGEKRNYYKAVTATSESEWSTREIYNIVDNNIDTPWQGHRIYWGDHHHDYVTLDLGSEKEISGLTWNNWRLSLTPTEYNILVSSDNKSWKNVSHKTNGEKKDGEGTTVLFEKQKARYVKIEILKTLTDDSPSISEIYVFNQLADFKDKDVVQSDPFSYVKNEATWMRVINTYDREVPVTVKYTTDSINKKTLPGNLIINPDGAVHHYKVIIPPGGNLLSEISFDTKLPLSIEIKSININNLTLMDMINKKIVKTFSVN